MRTHHKRESKILDGHARRRCEDGGAGEQGQGQRFGREEDHGIEARSLPEATTRAYCTGTFGRGTQRGRAQAEREQGPSRRQGYKGQGHWRTQEDDCQIFQGKSAGLA